MSTPQFIVTGGAGFIGCNIVAALNARGYHDIEVVDDLNHADKQANLDSVNYRDYTDKKAFRTRLLEGQVAPVTTVFHMGACSATTELDANYLNDNNLAYTRDLCEWCLAHDIRFIYASSAATYGDGTLGYSDADAQTPGYQPLNLYGKSKHDFDLWALAHGHLANIVGLKFFNVYGPHEDHKGEQRSVVHKAYGQIQETGSLKLFKSHRPDYGDGEQMRDFVYVKDAVDVALYFHDNPQQSGLFNCGTGKARTWLDLGNAVFAAMGRTPNIEMIDMPESIRDHYQYHTQADMAKLRKAGYAAPFTSLEDGIADYVQHYLQTRYPDS